MKNIYVKCPKIVSEIVPEYEELFIISLREETEDSFIYPVRSEATVLKLSEFLDNFTLYEIIRE